jgi:hypothetical protein
VLGAVDVDASWEEYVNNLAAMGVGEWVALSNAAYRRYKNMNKGGPYVE